MQGRESLQICIQHQLTAEGQKQQSYYGKVHSQCHKQFKCVTETIKFQANQVRVYEPRLLLRFNYSTPHILTKTTAKWCYSTNNYKKCWHILKNGQHCMKWDEGSRTLSHTYNWFLLHVTPLRRTKYASSDEGRWWKLQHQRQKTFGRVDVIILYKKRR